MTRPSQGAGPGRACIGQDEETISIERPLQRPSCGWPRHSGWPMPMGCATAFDPSHDAHAITKHVRNHPLQLILGQYFIIRGWGCEDAAPTHQEDRRASYRIGMLMMMWQRTGKNILAGQREKILYYYTM